MTSDTASVVALGAQGPDAPAFRVRTRLPGGALLRHGVEIRSLPLFTALEASRFGKGSALARARILAGARRRTARTLRDLDPRIGTALVQRQVDMLPSRRLERLAIAGRRTVLDIDDAIWHDTHPSAHGHPLAFLKDSSRKVRWLVGQADAVIAGNETLAEWLAGYATEVHVVPSLIVPDAYAVRAHVDGPTVVWGWIGSVSTAPHLHALAPCLAAAARALGGEPSVELWVVGGPAPNVPGVTAREIGWSEAVEVEVLGRLDIGLMPLPDDVWTRGKCAYKALQYMAAGIPVVADDVGVSAKVIGHGEGGLVASGAEGWVEALTALSRDPVQRCRLGSEGRRRVLESYSVDRWAAEMARILSGRP